MDWTQAIDESWGSPSHESRVNMESWPLKTCFGVMRERLRGPATAVLWCSIAVAQKKDFEIMITCIQRVQLWLGVKVIGIAVVYALQHVRANH